MTEFKEVTLRELTESPVKLIGDDWMLVTAGNEQKFNTMTASWGGVGVLWGKEVAFVFVRPQRYTYEFVEHEKHLTLSFFDEKYRSVLNFCGSKSGRDVDKVKETGLTPVVTEQGVYFEEAKAVMVCKKMYVDDLKESHFLSEDVIARWYPNKDFHRMYVCVVEKVLVK